MTSFNIMAGPRSILGLKKRESPSIKRKRFRAHEKNEIKLRNQLETMSLSLFGNPLASSLLTGDEPFTMDPTRWNRQALTSYSNDPATRMLGLSRLDFVESPNQFILSLDLPGLEKEQVNMRIQDDLLIVYGERASSKERDEGTSHISERSFGSFERRVRLPQSADQGKVEASMENGVLCVKIGMICFGSNYLSQNQEQGVDGKRGKGYSDSLKEDKLIFNSQPSLSH
jgi:HSP20 family molecular chaperone IbpA